MKIIRRNEYIAMPVRPLRSGELSIPAKGMLAVLFSLPEGRTMTDYDLVSACRMTLEDVSEVARELEQAARSTFLMPLWTGTILDGCENNEHKRLIVPVLHGTAPRQTAKPVPCPAGKFTVPRGFTRNGETQYALPWTGLRLRQFCWTGAFE